MTWKTVFLFIFSATLLILLSGWLIGANILPIQSQPNYSQAEKNFVRVWIQIAIAVGLLLPSFAFATGWRSPERRTVFGFYLLVLVVQILTEQICSQIFSRSLLVMIGTLYTVFRLWQLWQGRQVLEMGAQRSSKRIVHSLLWLLLLFWTVNLIFLLVVGWSNILSL
ncbi:hypothetical protein ACKFKG_09835 [Phormidesmis sp. 146-35]